MQNFNIFFQELEVDNRIINWNSEVTNRFHSRLYALWNRKNGDCLLDSVLQVCLGVWDTENTLRRAMAESLQNGSHKYDENKFLVNCQNLSSIDFSNVGVNTNV